MCTSPLKGFKIGTTVNGKPNYKITSYSTQLVYKLNNSWICSDTDFVSRYADVVVRDYIEIPCGKCLDCRLKFSRDWANRMMLEAQKYDENYFVTLTYDDDHLPISDSGINTVRVDDLQRFFKRLRKRIEPKKIRYYACAEYGEHTFRPHYHAIIFGLHIPDLEPFGYSGDYPVYISKWLSDIWRNGHIMVAPASWDTCAYTARYVTKKAKFPPIKEFYDDLGIENERSFMSRRPGIARDYFDEHFNEIYNTDQLILSTFKGGRIDKPPKYFDRCLEAIDEDRYNMIKLIRKEVSNISRQTLLCHTNLSYEEILRRRAAALDARTKVLKRLL